MRQALEDKNLQYVLQSFESGSAQGCVIVQNNFVHVFHIACCHNDLKDILESWYVVTLVI